ncbi:TPA: hypothetical protein JLY95_004483 [Escherichia coli]|nr:hypothetical protein [Escherichia coli]
MKTSIFKFCEGNATFTRVQLEKFVIGNTQCKRMAEQIGVDIGEFALGLSREFVARSMSCGYLDGVNRVYWVKNKRNKPYLMSLHATRKDDYFNDMVKLESLSYSDLFGETMVIGAAATTKEILRLKEILYKKTGNPEYALYEERKRLGLVP